MSLDYAGIPHNTFHVITVLMCADIVLGIMKGYVLREISSRPIITGITRKSLLLVALYMVCLGITVIPELGFVSRLFVGMVILAELISITRSTISIREKYKVSEHDALIKASEMLITLFERKGKIDD